jgi:hypothetical protein
MAAVPGVGAGGGGCAHEKNKKTRKILRYKMYAEPSVARSNARVCGRWLTGIAGLNPAEGIDTSLL